MAVVWDGAAGDDGHFVHRDELPGIVPLRARSGEGCCPFWGIGGA